MKPLSRGSIDQKTFHGKPCPKGHTLRYYDNRCAVCKQERYLAKQAKRKNG